MTDLENNKNYQEYLKARDAGKFVGLSEFAWVLFIQGEWVGTAETRQGVFDLRSTEVGDVFQPNAPKRVIRIGSPRTW